MQHSNAFETCNDRNYVIPEQQMALSATKRAATYAAGQKNNQKKNFSVKEQMSLRKSHSGKPK